MKKGQRTRFDALLAGFVAIVVISHTSPIAVHAQFTVQSSNSSGVIATTSGAASGALLEVNIPRSTFRSRYSSSGTRRFVYSAAVQLTEDLLQGVIPSSTTGKSRQPLSLSARTMLTGVLQGESMECFASCTEMLAQTFAKQGADEKSARNLANSLDGLLRHEHVSPSQLVESLEAFNLLVQTASVEFLHSPSEEFLGTHSVLSFIAEAASR